MATYHLRLKNDTKPNGQKVSAKRHVDYILREGEKKSDLMYQASQLPKWAEGSAQKFFFKNNQILMDKFLKMWFNILTDMRTVLSSALGWQDKC